VLGRPDDFNLFAMHKGYFDQNQTIWDKLVVEPAAVDRRFHLTVEEPDLLNGRVAFVAATRKLLQHPSYEDDIFRAAEAADRIGRSQSLEAPGSLGILAACVLVAASMTADDGFSAAAYYPRFNREILDIDDLDQPKRFEKLSDKWIELAAIIKRKKLGELMIPKNPTRAPIRNRKNINYPLSQCLFRKVDIEKLVPQLREWASLGLRGDDAFSRLLMHVDHFRKFSAPLISSLEVASRDPDVREAYCDALDELIADTTRHVVVAKRVAAKIKGDSAGIARLAMAPVRQSDEWAYDLVLEYQTSDDWQKADFRCEADDVVGNTIVEIDGRRYRYLGADPQVFFEHDGLDIVTERGNKLPSYARLVIVASTDYEKELIGFAKAICELDRNIREPVQSLQLLDRFKSLCAIRFTFSLAGLPPYGLPECMQKYDIAAPSTLRENGGLKIGADYLVGCPPRLELTWDSSNGDVPALFCDEKELVPRQLEDRVEVDLSEFAYERGLHYISSSDARLKLAFRIIDPEPIITTIPVTGSFNAMYFGPNFLKFVKRSSDIKKALQQAQKPGSDCVFMHGAWLVSGPSTDND
jgi:hypothetical protein